MAEEEVTKKRKLQADEPTELLISKSSYKKGEQISSKGSVLLFKGTLNENIPIALKRYQSTDETISTAYKRDLERLSSPENRHPNFIRYFGLAEDKDRQFNYLAIELCVCSVGDYIRNEPRVPQDMISTISTNLNHKEILRQSFEAVSFLHSLGYIHRNLHPNNFLISLVDTNKKEFLIKLTDFQLSKEIIKNKKEQSGTQAKEGWVAPETFNLKSELTDKVDAFIMGCYCYYVLSEGNHPFGSTNIERRGNIKDIKNTYEVYKPNWKGGNCWKKEEEATWALEMIKDLIKKDPLERKSVEDVLLRNKYFQPETYQIYDHPEAKIPGLCVIVTQDLYHNPAHNLCWEDNSGRKYPGVNIDANNLQMTFSSFGYDIISLKNLQAHEIIRYLSPNELLKLIDAQNKKPDGSSSFKNYASLVVCLLGHGSQGAFIGVDNFPVSLNTIQYDAFDDNACLDLSGKPKVFIILACQGDKPQQKIQRQQASALVPTLPTVTPTATGVKDEERTPPVFDFIRLMSTIEGYQAFVYPHEGSAFINSLCHALNYEYKELLVNEEEEKDKREKEEKKILKKSLGKRDLTQLFTTFVTPVVGSNERYWQTPEFRSSLSKTIRFRRMQQNPLELVKPAYDGSEKEHFKEAREYKISQGWEAGKM